MTEEEILFTALNAAVDEHVKKIAGIPLSSTEAVARFIIYGGVLLQFYKMTPDELARMLVIASNITLTAESIPNTIGRAN